jgi:hypothetical protein
MTRMSYKEVACTTNMVTLRTFTGLFTLMCLRATSPSVAFVRQWLNQGVSSILQPADTLLCQCDPAHWHCTTLYSYIYNTCLT